MINLINLKAKYIIVQIHRLLRRQRNKTVLTLAQLFIFCDHCSSKASKEVVIRYQTLCVGSVATECVCSSFVSFTPVEI